MSLGNLGRRLSLAAILLLAVLAGIPAAAPVHASQDQDDQIAWTPCPENHEMWCGTLRLPVDWANPSGETFDLALAKRPATNPVDAAMPLLVNPGGPGGSGVDMAFAASAFFGSEILNQFDIIGIDPRGVAGSHAVVCPQGALERPGATILPRNQQEFDQLKAYNRALAVDCRRETGPLFDHVDSVSVARDIEAVRKALGVDKLNWYGSSYGSLMGQMYAELFPDRIRAIVNDGNMDHSLGTRQFLLTEARFVEDSFEQFVRWCNRSVDCGLHGEDVEQVYAELLHRADAGHLFDPADDTRVSSWYLLDITQFFFNRPRWSQLGDYLESLFAGTPSASAKVARTVHKAAGNSVRQGKLVEDVRAQFCEDWSLPVADFEEFDRLWNASLRAAPRMRTSVLALSSVTQCLGWPGAVNNPQHELQVEASPTLLMLNGVHDPATGYDWALNVADQFGQQAVLVTYEGSGHTVYRRNSCTRDITHRYLLSLIAPASGTRCPASDPPATTAQDATATAGDPVRARAWAPEVAQR